MMSTLASSFIGCTLEFMMLLPKNMGKLGGAGMVFATALAFA